MDTEASGHILISKQDGSIAREIQIPFKEIKTPVFTQEELTVMPAFYLTEAFSLVEAYGKGQLKGKLKEIAATLDEESNPVIMLIKHKK
ncbi:MAG: hypothetical protein LBL58_06680 [Tannerellaceae bacterium]|jgi:hypothetical protein|nr:hypothetical protein [Tannerellaceae bacterium]